MYRFCSFMMVVLFLVCVSEAQAVRVTIDGNQRHNHYGKHHYTKHYPFTDRVIKRDLSKHLRKHHQYHNYHRALNHKRRWERQFGSYGHSYNPHRIIRTVTPAYRHYGQAATVYTPQSAPQPYQKPTYYQPAPQQVVYAPNTHTTSRQPLNGLWRMMGF